MDEISVDLNGDLGEGVGDDAAMFPLVTSANVACGYHAGDAATMRSSCLLAVEHRVSLGAHVSYLDREGFGRRDQDLPRSELTGQVLRQLEALAAIATATGTRIRYVKPHGALYNRIAVDREQADAVASAVRDFDATLPILGLPDSEIARAAAPAGLGFRREAFVDRAYRPDGTLVPRSEPGAVLHDVAEIADRALRMILDPVGGSVIDSLCVHGDTPGAVRMAQAVRQALATAGIEVAAFA